MITEDGTRYRVRHERRYAFGITRSAAMNPPPLAKGGRTVVQIIDESGAVVVEAEARCRSNENYNRRLGRTIALGRALKKMGANGR